MMCVACGGVADIEKRCPECKGRGAVDITQCPLEIITEDVWEMIRLADFYEKGLPPVSGGVLDQAKIFNDATRFWFGEKAYWKKKLGIFD